MDKVFQKSDFDAFSGKTLHLQAEDAGHELTLAEIKVLTKHNHPNARAEPFSLFFTGKAPALPQKIYPLQFATDDLRQIFLVPVAEKDGLITYQALFN